jgi:hypothetical protein
VRRKAEIERPRPPRCVGSLLRGSSSSTGTRSVRRWSARLPQGLHHPDHLDEPNPSHPVCLLRARCWRPSGHRAAEQADECATASPLNHLVSAPPERWRGQQAF